MQEVTVLDYKNIEHKGKWNGRTYKSKVEEDDGLYRIYLNNNAVHITHEELDRLTGHADKIRIEDKQNFIMKFIDELNNMDELDMVFAFNAMLCNDKLRHLCASTEERQAYKLLQSSMHERLKETLYYN